ncbi:DUF402 domain-containing protein [Nocardioides insulae]|uniref:DUF402 domain-containing protein n=1 Tax=Nocardioides insulae TaxID=394734 RepID=UPI000415A983|nr:DUF402 domain-containing protein [Nocardioides insulae]
MPRFEAGRPVSVEMTKWGGRRHWQYDGHFLGEDTFGDWVGFPAGTHNHRPGLEFHSRVDTVMLVPARGAFLAGFHAPGIWCTLYTDITTPAEWDDDVLRAVDLDLDIVTRSDGTTTIDDEEEFEEHQLLYGYPPEIITMAEESAERVYDDVVARRPPYDGTAAGWLERLAALGR